VVQTGIPVVPTAMLELKSGGATGAGDYRNATQLL